MENPKSYKDFLDTLEDKFCTEAYVNDSMTVPAMIVGEGRLAGLSLLTAPCPYLLYPMLHIANELPTIISTSFMKTEHA